MSGEESTRLFVGGLSQQLPEEELKQQLSNFGTVKKLEIKEKKDLCTGEVIKRFAFATLDSSRSRIDQCIRSLDGKSLHGSELTLERAQESFIDRLNREREARAQGKTIEKTGHHQQNNQHDYQFNFGGVDDSNTRYNNNNNQEEHSWQRPVQSGRDDSNQYGGQKRGRGWEEDEDKQKVPEELFPSRDDQQQWRDEYQSDDRRDDESSRYRTASPPPQKWAKIAPRYDPKKKNSAAAAPANMTAAMTDPATQAGQTLQQLPKAALVPTTVSADLTFTGASQGFSLLSMLEKTEPVTVVATDAGDETEATALDQKDVVPESDEVKQRDVKPLLDPVMPVAEKKQPTAVKTYIKKSKFFIDIDDAEVEENLRWVYREIPESQLAKFNKDRPEIMKLYHEKHRRANAGLRQDTNRPSIQGNQQTWSGDADDDGETAVMAAYDYNGPVSVALATDSLGGATQGAMSTVAPAVNENREQDADTKKRGGAGVKGKGRGQRPPGRGGRGGGGGNRGDFNSSNSGAGRRGSFGSGGRGKHVKTHGKEDRGRCPG